MFVSEALGGAWSEKITSRMGETAAFWVNFLALGMSLAVLGFLASKLVVPILMLYGFLQGFLRPLASTYANRYIESEHRATVISVQVMVSTVAAVGAAVRIRLSHRSHRGDRPGRRPRRARPCRGHCAAAGEAESARHER